MTFIPLFSNGFANAPFAFLLLLFFFIGITLEWLFRNESSRFKFVYRALTTIVIAVTPLCVWGLTPRADYYIIFAIGAAASWLGWILGGVWYRARLKAANKRRENQDAQLQSSSQEQTKTAGEM